MDENADCRPMGHHYHSGSRISPETIFSFLQLLTVSVIHVITIQTWSQTVPAPLIVCNLLKLQYLNMYHAMIYIYILLCNGSS